MGLFGEDRSRKVLAVSLEPQTIVAMNKVIDKLGGKGNLSKWVEKVILRALKEDWDIEIVQTKTVAQMTRETERTRSIPWEPSQKQKDDWQKKIEEFERRVKV